MSGRLQHACKCLLRAQLKILPLPASRSGHSAGSYLYDLGLVTPDSLPDLSTSALRVSSANARLNFRHMSH